MTGCPGPRSPYSLEPDLSRKVAAKKSPSRPKRRLPEGLGARWSGWKPLWRPEARYPLQKGVGRRGQNQPVPAPTKAGLPGWEPGREQPRHRERHRLQCELDWLSSSLAVRRLSAGQVWPPGLAVKPRWCYSNPWDAPLACLSRSSPEPVDWALNSAVECHLHTVEVTGSNPVAPTMQIIDLHGIAWKSRPFPPQKSNQQFRFWRQRRNSNQE